MMNAELIDRILIDLEIIGRLRVSDKLAVHALPGATRLSVDADSYTQCIRRWYYGSCRNTALDYVNDVVENCQSAAALVKEGCIHRIAVALATSITRALEGLTNLQTTYMNDCTTAATIGLQIAKLKEITLMMQETNPHESSTPSRH